uniref:CCHC-type domain-containing protein n=1 Tax=Opuntia streptacantha TaxID=393608 RepID=A0A7C9E6U4_OPUST
MAAPPFRIPRTCSQCGNNGHNARTCTESPAAATNATAAAGFMLFGVRLTAAEGSPSLSSSTFRKSMSMNNLSQYEQKPQDSSGGAADVGASGYASDDAVHASSSHTRERKRGTLRLFFGGGGGGGKGVG